MSKQLPLKTMFAAGAMLGGLLTLGHHYTNKVSPFMMACNAMDITGTTLTQKFDDGSVIKFDISARKQQEAILQILNMSGLLSPEIIWDNVNRLGFTDPTKTYIKIMREVERAGGNKPPSDFNSTYLRKVLFADMSDEDAADILTYWSQNAFARHLHHERNELTGKKWMESFPTDFRTSVYHLGMLDRTAPVLHEYNEVVIAGASRPGMKARIIDLAYMLKEYGLEITSKNIVMLAGARPLWAEIDGMSPSMRDALDSIFDERGNLDKLALIYKVHTNDGRTEEGIEFLLQLADYLEIKYDRENAIVKFSKGETIPKGLIANRHYFISQDKKTLTETDLAKYSLEKYASDLGLNVHIVDTKSEDGENRPTTATTAADYARDVYNRIIKGDLTPAGDGKVHLLFVTNNPYTQRQSLVTQSVFDKLQKENKYPIDVVIHGVGFGAKQDIPPLFSEFGALIDELYKQAVREGHLHPTRRLEDLEFRTRDNSKKDFGSPPEITPESWDEWFQHNVLLVGSHVEECLCD